MNDAKLMLLVESKKKSGWLAAVLNLVLPGAGYAYCGRWILGIVVFAILLALSIAAETPAVALGFALILAVDGFLAANRYNKKMIQAVLADSDRQNQQAA